MLVRTHDYMLQCHLIWREFSFYIACCLRSREVVLLCSKYATMVPPVVYNIIRWGQGSTLPPPPHDGPNFTQAAGTPPPCPLAPSEAKAQICHWHTPPPPPLNFYASAPKGAGGIYVFGLSIHSSVHPRSR